MAVRFAHSRESAETVISALISQRKKLPRGKPTAHRVRNMGALKTDKGVAAGFVDGHAEDFDAMLKTSEAILEAAGTATATICASL